MTHPASAATPNDVLLSSEPTGESNSLQIVGADSQGIIYLIKNPHTGVATAYLRHPDGTVETLPDSFANRSNTYFVFNGAIIGTYDGANQTFTYRTVADSTFVTTPAIPSDATFLAGSPRGFVYVEPSGGGSLTHLYNDDVISGTVTDLGAIPAYESLSTAKASADGVLLSVWATSGLLLYYVRFSDPGHFVLVDHNAGGVTAAFSDTYAIWADNPTELDENYDPSQTYIARMRLTDLSVTRIHAPNAGGIALTDTAIGYEKGYIENGVLKGEFITMPVAGGPTSTLTGMDVGDIGSTGTDFVLGVSGTADVAGLYAATSATSTPTELMAAGAATPYGYTVALSPGRAAWIDNGAGADAWSTSLTSNGVELSAGESIALTADANISTIAASGTRTAYFTGYGPTSLMVQSPGEPALQVASSVSGSDSSLQMSGMRLLRNNDDGSAVLYDLVRNTSTDLPSPVPGNRPNFVGTPTYALSGNQLAYLTADGSVWVKDLSSGDTVRASDPVVGEDQTVEGAVAISGDTVAWSVTVCQPDVNGFVACFTNLPVQYRNWQTLGPIMQVADGEYAGAGFTNQFQLSNGYLAYQGQGFPGVSAVDVVKLDDPRTSVGSFPDVSRLNSVFSLSGSTIGWLSSDDGLPHAEALPHIADQPWYLGDGIAPTAFSANGSSTWDADFVTSEALTECDVNISAGGSVVRVLPCDSAAMAMGEAEVSWDGKDSGGNDVAAGSYNWTLTGSNADGTILDADGGNSAVTGTITVSRPDSGGGSVGGGGSGGGSGGGGGGAPTGTTGSPQPVTAGGTVWSAGTTPTESQPVTVGVTSPVAGTVTVSTSTDSTPHAGNKPVLELQIDAPAASVAHPLDLTFKVDVAELPDGSFPSDVTIFRNGGAVAPCASATATSASPDPCVKSSSVSNGVATFDVLTSHASTWQLETADVGRIAGTDRFATAVAASQAGFSAGEAGAVVLARSDDYADALVGAPLAAAKNAPLLLTSGSQLPAATKQELLRVLHSGGTVYLLGGTAAVPASVESEVKALGYSTTRLAGANRFATAVAIADALGNPGTVLLATGTNYPDALAAGPAAAQVSGVVLLTSGNTLPAETSAYLAAHATKTYAIGGPAAQAVPTATSIKGADRYQTAAAVAGTFFSSPGTIGIATGENFPDALAAGALLSHTGAPLVLTATSSLPASTSAYLTGLTGSTVQVHVFGGTSAISAAVQTEIINKLN